MLRAFACIGLVLGLVLGAGPGWADEIDDGGEQPPALRRGEPPEPMPPAPRAPAPAATAVSPASDCVWLPDFRCGRSGRWEGFQQPIAQPFQFEDPFITTGVTAYYIWHEFPSDSAFGGGDLQTVAVQARVALTDRLAFIATKDGYVWTKPDNPLLRDETGWFNIAGGFKYALYQDREKETIVSAALRLEVPSGSSAVFEGETGGVIFIPSISAAWGWNKKLHVIGDVGGHAPTDGDLYSSQFFYHLYVDYSLHKYFQPFFQVSGQYWVAGGDGSRSVTLSNGATLPLETARQALGLDTFEGVDVINLGNSNVGGNHMLVGAFGAHIPITKNVVLSVAYEIPFTSREDLTRQRVTTALRLEF
jgi:hypothetical protein